MTVSTAYSGPQTSACDGSTTSFPVAFQYADKSGLVVELVDDATGTATILTEGTDYTRSGDGMSAPSSITTLSAYPAGKSIRRSRATPREQTLLAPANSLPQSALMERAWDRAILALQEVDAHLGNVFAKLLRTWLAPEDGSADGKYPVVLPGGGLGFASGTGTDGALRADLAVKPGAGLVGAQDGGSGSAWTTVQGFINRIISSAGSTYVQYLNSASSAVMRSVGFVLDLLSITPETFGATANNMTVDNSGPLNIWLAAAAAGRPVRLPNKSYYFKGSLVCAAANDIEITGRGQLIYNGASTTRDLLTFGSTSTQSIRLRLCGLRMSSLTTMTAGTALRFDKVYRSTLRDIILDGQDGTGNFWHGLWFNGCDVNTLAGFQLTAAGDALRINDGSDLFLDDGKICPADNPAVALRSTACGFRVGGGFGGVYLGSVDIIGCDVNMILDNTLSSANNREIAFSGTAALDSSKVGANLYLNETSGAPVYIVGAGAWFASAKTDNISIASSSSTYHILLNGGRIYNAQRDGIRNNASLAVINLNGVEIIGNAGYGVNNPAANSTGVSTIGCIYSGNALGDTSGIVMDPLRTTVVTVANGANIAIPGSAGMAVITLADAGAHSAAYMFGGGTAALLGGTNAIFVAPTTTPAAGKVSFAYSGSGNVYRIYNNSGGSVRFHVVVNRAL